MIKKIISISFTVVLVLSLGLAYATPVMAVGPETTTVSLTSPGNVYRPAEFTVSSTIESTSSSGYDDAKLQITLSGPEDFTGDRANTFTITKVNGSTSTDAINSTFTLTDGNWVGYYGTFDMTSDYNETNTFTFQMCDTGTASSI